MTAAMSGFLEPEERETRKTSQAISATSDLAQAILKVLQTQGPTNVTVLQDQLKARPRVILTTVTELSDLDAVRLWDRGDDELVELTDLGRKQII